MLNFIPVTTQQQISLCERLAFDIWQEHYVPIIGPKQVRYMLENFQSAEAIGRQIVEEQYAYFLIQLDDIYIGYFSLRTDPEDNALFLSKIYLLEGQRGRGLGRQTFDYIQQLAADAGCKRIHLTVNKNNKETIAFYEACGFKNTGSVVQDIGEGFVMDDFAMVKEL
ncbi:MAG: GNAT family N-acetyltransferase [Candidatus Omnitrophica bacterium]|nr:GNAT family N-acetyltransferase [Candidatus Omnitrophota bacterium]MCB9721734.1 GNAT family N-acetyltransferase [Candidatus Omnitrophota bacterium]